MDNGRTFEFVWPLLLIGLGLLLYFLPSFIGRNKRDKVAIFMLNLLTGWSVIGWLAAFIWALTNDSVTAVVVQSPTPMQTGPALLCTCCGKYSLPGSKFCPSCGQPF
jgi:hypothetical protein